MNVNFGTLLVGACAALVLAACGGPATLSVESPAIATVAPGGSSTFSVSLARVNTKGDFALGVSGLPSGVSATFSPAVAGEDVESLSLTLTATREAARGPALLTLTATGTGTNPLIASTTLALEVRGITVKGRVELIQFPVGLPGVRVLVGDTLTATDSEGRFSIQDVALPYDLSIGSTMLFESYPGLTTAEPVIRTLFGTGAVGEGGAEVELALSAPVPENEYVLICASGVDGLAGGCERLEAGDTSGYVNVGWLNAATRQVRLQAYGYKADDSGLVTAFTSSAQSPTLTLEHGAEVTLTLTMGAAPATTTEAFPIETPYWANATSVMTLAPLATSGYTPIGAPGAPGTAQIFEGAPKVVIATGRETSGVSWRPASDSSASPMTFPTRPALLTRTVGASLSTEFLLAAPAAGELSMLGLTTESSIILVYTMTDRVRIPDLTPLLGPDPVSFSGAALIARGSGYASMDDAVTGNALLGTFAALELGGVLPDFSRAGGLTIIAGEAP